MEYNGTSYLFVHHGQSRVLIMKHLTTIDTSSSVSPLSLSTHPAGDLRREAGDHRRHTMSISHTLKEYLDREHVHYDVLPHPEAFRALAIAHVLHTPEKEMAKVVIVKVEDGFVMTVLPASWQVDLLRLRDMFMTTHVRLATEDEFKDLFPDCEVGAMPPFGILYGLPVYVDHSLTEDKSIVFQAGTHSEAIRMRYMDFAALVFPVVEEFHRSPSEVW